MPVIEEGFANVAAERQLGRVQVLLVLPDGNRHVRLQGILACPLSPGITGHVPAR